jgi:hypothetical protein
MQDISVSAIQVLATIGILAAMLVALLATRPRGKASREVVRRFEEMRILIFLFGLIMMVLVAVYASAGGKEWGFALALLPFIMIVQHAMFLRNVRQPILVPRQGSKQQQQHGKPAVPDPQHSPDGHPTSRAAPDDGDWWRPVLVAAKLTTKRYFSASSLAIRYGASAVAVLMVGLVAFLVVFGPGQSMLLDHDLERPAMLGTVRAYVYVLLHLGYRNFTHDVTSGGAMWCSISLATGPILACAISYFLVPTAQDSNPGADAIFFMAGLSPRYVTSRVEDLVKRTWGSSAAVGAPAPRIIPVTQVKGITPEIADRLAEEGIADVHGLAMADPLRLIRNTNFDRRLIVSWIDEAILITTLPGRWKLLEEEGITGAVALVSLVYPPPYLAQGARAQENEYPASVKLAHLTMLCRHLSATKGEHGELAAGEDENAQMIRSIAAQLQSDAQLRLIWVLLNHIGDEDLEGERWEEESSRGAELVGDRAAEQAGRS